MSKTEQLTQQLKALIQNGTWLAHQKLPSLRTQAQTSQLSVITVLNAYQNLEAQGLIYSKEKSGFYVTPQRLIPTSVQPNINSTVFNYLQDIKQYDEVNFGSAFPDKHLLYNTNFFRLMAKNAQTISTNDDMPPGNLQLRTQIAIRYTLAGLNTHVQDLVITSGALDALNLALETITTKGDYIVLQETIFYGAWQAAERLGLKVITVPNHPQTGIDLTVFENLLSQYPIKVCWLMVNSHNPIGFTLDNATKQKIAQLVHQYKVYLIEDDAYQELYFEAPAPLSIKYFDQDDRIIHCASFSKVLGANARIGWVNSRCFSAHIQHLQLMSRLSAHPLTQKTLADFLATHHYEKHLQQLRKNLQQNKLAYYTFLRDQGLTLDYYPSGYFLWITLPKDLASFDLFQTLLHKKIGIAPSELFTLNHTNFIRLNCSAPLTPHKEQALQILVNHILKRF
ncbi:aminotransferase-like domain-containing protein [Acinetobacter sp. HY1485]|uniref:aminotransferase-like domain-containing protein n=1 Tax=Acinetobacter sp. HY1485 TaxID=2970918 RepID=UPI0022B94E75|nr:PLP-dependent aminotransferase family protein [Acinetobacter sp. HY1485]